MPRRAEPRRALKRSSRSAGRARPARARSSGTRTPAGARAESPSRPAAPVRERAQDVLASLRRLASARIRDEMVPRYGNHAAKALGVPMGAMQRLAKGLGTDHALAAALWQTGWYEARIVAALIDDPAQVSPAQMDRWARDFDNWGIVDTVCFKLFDRTPHALGRVRAWAGRREEFVRRAAFALLACVALHDRVAEDAAFVRCLPLIERGAADERNFVQKGVSWALRSIGRRNPSLRTASVKVAARLAASASDSARWVGKDTLRDLRPKKTGA